MKVTDKLLTIIKDGTVDWVLPAHFVYSFDKPQLVDKIRFLAAISLCESSGGVHRVPRFEKGYAPGGAYYNSNLYNKWGAWACCSYSSFQIMFATATELGYDSNPVELHLKDEVAIVWVKKYFEKRCFSKTTKFITIGNAGDAYNTGSFFSGVPPAKYISELYTYYTEVELG
jgi:hypothetical protein